MNVLFCLVIGGIAAVISAIAHEKEARFIDRICALNAVGNWILAAAYIIKGD